MQQKREIDLVVLSDIHLGTIGCHADELNHYLGSIHPKTLVLNGDILDMWQFKTYYWPKSHMKVIKKLVNFATNGTHVYYLTGNHDETLRRFSDLTLGQFHLRDKLLLDINGDKAWIFHGDVFDISMKHSKWLAKLGGFGYNLLILINRMINRVSEAMGYGKLSLSKKIKYSVKKAISFIDDFEKTATELAIEKGYKYVICGHIHQPVIKEVTSAKGSVTYLNSGDWIENLTSLEFHEGAWTLFHYYESGLAEEWTHKKLPQSNELEETGSLLIDVETNLLEEILFQR